MLSNLLYSVNVVLPIVLLMALGYFLRRIGMITEGFISVSTRLAFTVAFPCSVFSSLQGQSIRETFDPGLVFFMVSVIVLSMALLLVIVPLFVKDRPLAAAMVQGMFRANFLVQGLPLLTIMYGEGNFAECAVLLPFAIVANNVMATIDFVALIPEQRGDGKRPILNALVKMAKNPLIIGCVAGIVFAALQWELPSPVGSAVSQLGKMAMPMALLALGAEFRFRDLKEDLRYTLPTVLVRLVVLPAFITVSAVWLGFRGTALGGLFLFNGAASAASGYIMCKTMGGNDRIAAQSVCLSTMLSAFTIMMGIFILKTYNLI
jgi:predicted permease